MSEDVSINANVSGGAVGVVAQQVHIEHQYVGMPEPSARAPADLGIARIFQTRTRPLPMNISYPKPGQCHSAGAMRNCVAWTHGSSIRKARHGCW